MLQNLNRLLDLKVYKRQLNLSKVNLEGGNNNKAKLEEDKLQAGANLLGGDSLLAEDSLLVEDNLLQLSLVQLPAKNLPKGHNKDSQFRVNHNRVLSKETLW